MNKHLWRGQKESEQVHTSAGELGQGRGPAGGGERDWPHGAWWGVGSGMTETCYGFTGCPAV